MSRPALQTTSPSLQPCIDAASDTVYRNLTKLNALYAVIDGVADAFEQLDPSVRATYRWVCADLTKEAKAAWVQLETLRAAGA